MLKRQATAAFLLPARSFSLLSPLECAVPSTPDSCTILVQITPLDSALTDARLVTPLKYALTEKGGGGYPRYKKGASLGERTRHGKQPCRRRLRIRELALAFAPRLGVPPLTSYHPVGIIRAAQFQLHPEVHHVDACDVRFAEMRTDSRAGGADGCSLFAARAAAAPHS